ncbi:unnamed protein product [Linum tenue]|uniref:X8 domain-containing protein n=1 Tax=Linum tenue TaxID=586396 RepID=A0AAV0LSV4_9ROSI|nr:unnamed protein product [Linum tenue]
MAASPSLLSALLLHHFLLVVVVEGSSSWCVVRTDASYQALKAALDYACWAGADCTPIQSNGLCFLPNTIQAHASYAFNSFYQRKGMSPDSCYFSGTANIARTDPSQSLLLTSLFFLCFPFLLYTWACFLSFIAGYGSCVYPGSLRYFMLCYASFYLILTNS